MDIISHTLTGVAVGTVLTTISNANWKQKGLVILAGALGGGLPDFDAISLWSKFDSTIGLAFDLKHSGKEIYFGKFWYSHHGAFHSILAPLMLIFVSVLVKSIRKNGIKRPMFLQQLNLRKYSLIAFFFGFHISFIRRHADSSERLGWC